MNGIGELLKSQNGARNAKAHIGINPGELKMKMVRKSDRKDKTGRSAFSFFCCEFCDSEVEKRTQNGIRAKSCGCIQYRRIHNGCHTSIYKVWENMKTRCFNKNIPNFKYHGGRGISVCKEWLDFVPFKTWANKSGYKKGLTIDRINNDGNYSPDNCRFITHTENMRNRRNTKLSWEKVLIIRSLHASKHATISEIANVYMVSRQLIQAVIKNKIWRIEYGKEQ